MLNGKFNDKWLEMWYDKLVRRCETEMHRHLFEEDTDAFCRGKGDSFK